MKDTLYLTFIVQKMSILNNDGLKCGIGRKVQKIVYIKRDINIEKLQITLNQGYSLEFRGEPKLISKQQSPKGRVQQ